jgi:hypothetical protein
MNFAATDFLIVLQWIACLFSILIGWEYVDSNKSDDSDLSKIFFIILLNAIILHSLYTDVILYYGLLTDNPPSGKMTLIEVMNMFPLSGIGRSLAFVCLIFTFSSLSSSVSYPYIMTILIVINVIAGLVSIPFALL